MASDRGVFYPWYCGCCGRALPEQYEGSLWCADCKGHVAPLFETGGQRRQPWEQTWFAQHGSACPFDTADAARDVIREAASWTPKQRKAVEQALRVMDAPAKTGGRDAT